MNMQTSDMKVFLQSLNQGQMDECENDEKKLIEILASGWSEHAGVRFHRAMLCLRCIDPKVTVEGVFEVALRIGLEALQQNRKDDPAKRRAAQRDRQLRELQKSENRRKRAGVRGI
jgi:hypothetical protein